VQGDETLLGAPFYAMARIAGQVPGDNPPYTVDGWLLEATPAERERLYWSALEAMARVHRLDWRTLGFGFLDKPARGAPGLDQQLDYYRDYCRWAARGRPQPIARPPSSGSWPTARRATAGRGSAGATPHRQHDLRGLQCRAVLDWRW
jgi:aminoglycoside phosphotransferase (APT) family kinase protein